MSSMNIYRGKMVIDVVTAVESNNEEVMTEKAHDRFTTELMDKIQAVLGAEGYITESIGAALENNGKASDLDLDVIKKEKIEGERRVNLYKLKQVVIDL